MDYAANDAAKRVLADRWFIPARTLRYWKRFRPFEQIRNDLCRLPVGAVPTFISHRWLTRAHPDPDGEQYALVAQYPMQDEYIWYDYSCMPQSELNAYNKSVVLDTLHTQVRASVVIFLRSLDDDFFRRGWCFHEWFTAQFIGSVERLFPHTDYAGNNLFTEQIVEAKRFVDRVIAGEDDLLNLLTFTDQRDKAIVIESARIAVELLKVTIVERMFPPLFAQLEDCPQDMTDSSIFQFASSRFDRVAEFVKLWARFLQPVEPVSNRVAVFLSLTHTDAFLDLTDPYVANKIVQYFNRRRPRRNLQEDAERKVQNCMEFCERHFPKPAYVVAALLCQTLLR